MISREIVIIQLKEHYLVLTSDENATEFLDEVLSCIVCTTPPTVFTVCCVVVTVVVVVVTLLVVVVTTSTCSEFASLSVF